MCLGFVVVEGPAAGSDLPIFVRERTESAAIGAGLLIAQQFGLLIGGLLQRAGQQSAQGGHGNIFHLLEVDIQARPLFAPLLPDNDFAPALGQLVDLLEILW